MKSHNLASSSLDIFDIISEYKVGLVEVIFLGRLVKDSDDGLMERRSGGERGSGVNEDTYQNK
jgi:hypothetical protein